MGLMPQVRLAPLAGLTVYRHTHTLAHPRLVRYTHTLLTHVPILISRRQPPCTPPHARCTSVSRRPLPILAVVLISSVWRCNYITSLASPSPLTRTGESVCHQGCTSPQTTGTWCSRPRVCSLRVWASLHQDCICHSPCTSPWRAAWAPAPRRLWAP